MGFIQVNIVDAGDMLGLWLRLIWCEASCAEGLAGDCLVDMLDVADGVGFITREQVDEHHHETFVRVPSSVDVHVASVHGCRGLVQRHRLVCCCTVAGKHSRVCGRICNKLTWMHRSTLIYRLFCSHETACCSPVANMFHEGQVED